MLAAVLDFILKATRPLFFAAFFGGALLYFMPRETVVAFGFSSTLSARWAGVVIQVIAGAALAWPLVERLWTSGYKRQLENRERERLRGKVRLLSTDAREVLSFVIHPAEDTIWLPMRNDGALELERAGLLRRWETSQDVAKLKLTTLGEKLKRDQAWAIAELPCSAELYGAMSALSAKCLSRFVRRI
jgi:hypothetical protein